MKHNSPLDSPGFWGKVTSTIDWCEPNYTHTPYVAEFWNTMSSFLMCIGGFIGMYWAWKCGHPKRVIFFGGLLTLVGFGSAAFHGTLLFHTQMLDELPMIYAMAHWWYIWLDNISQARTLIRPSLSVNSLWLKSVKWLGWVQPILVTLRKIPGISFLLATPNRAFATYLIVWTYLHVSIGFTTVFQVHFGMLVFVGVVYIWEFQKHYPGMPSETRRLRNLLFAFGGLVCVAFFFWITDNIFCTSILPLSFYPHGHALWHLFVGLATYISFIICTVGNTMSLTSELPGPHTKPSEMNLDVSLESFPTETVHELETEGYFAGVDRNNQIVVGLREEEIEKLRVDEIDRVPLICKNVTTEPVPVYCGGKKVATLPMYPYVPGVNGERV